MDNQHEDERLDGIFESLYGQNDWFKRLRETATKIDQQTKPEPNDDLPLELARFWEEYPEAHQCLIGGRVNPFTGEIKGGELFEKQEVNYKSYGPAYFPSKSGSFLENLLAEMQRNPEWKEHHSESRRPRQDS